MPRADAKRSAACSGSACDSGVSPAALVRGHRSAIGPGDRGAALHPRDELVGGDEHHRRGNLEGFRAAKRRDEQALGIAAHVDGLGEATDVVLSHGAVGDADADAARTPQRPRLKHQLVVGDGPVGLDYVGSGLGQKDLSELASIFAFEGGEVRGGEATLGLRRASRRRGGRHQAASSLVGEPSLFTESSDSASSLRSAAVGETA